MQKPRAISNQTIVGLIVVHLAITLPLALSLNIWHDEGSSLYTTQHGFFAALDNAVANEKQAPLYFWILGLWRLADDSIFFARLFSIVCSVAAIAVFSRFAHRTFEPRPALLASAFFALHPVLVWVSLEIRGYALVILLAIVLTKLFFDSFLRNEENSRYSQVAFATAAAVALYTHYYLGFLLAGLLVALIAIKDWKAARRFALLTSAAGAAFLPLAVATASSQFSARTGSHLERISALEVVQILWHHAVTFLLPAEILRGDIGSDFATLRVWFARAALVVLAILVFRFRDKITRQTQVLAIVFFVVAGCFFAIGFLFTPAYIGLRHATPLFVPLVLSIASIFQDVFSEIRERTSRIAIFAGGLMVLASFSYSLTTLYPNTTKRGDWARVGAFIEQNESFGQPIVVFPVFQALALPYQYNGVNRILPESGFFTYGAEAEFGSPASLTKEIDFLIDQFPADTEHVWLAVGEICTTTEACQQLENFIHANYTIEKEQDFYLEKLFLLRKVK